MTEPKNQAASTVFEPIVELGRGGMGRVVLARRRGAMGFARVVVVKRLHEHLLDDEAVVKRFLAEAKIASRVHHANVVGVQEVGKDERGYYVVFDYVEGDSLQGLLERAYAHRKRLSPRIVIRAILDVLEGLQAVHDATDDDGRPLGILHRDVSTDNVLVGRDGIGRLTDFGMARDDRKTQWTEPGTVVGKALYVAPEYVLEKPVDRRIDVYGAGVTLWVSLASAEPWREASDASIMVKAITDGIPLLSTMLKRVPSAMDVAIARAVARDPDERYGSAREMAATLAAAAEEWVGVATRAEITETLEDLAGADLAERRAAIAKTSQPEPEIVIPPRRSRGSEPPESRRTAPPVTTPAHPRPTPSALRIAARWAIPTAVVATVAIVGAHLFSTSAPPAHLEAPVSASAAASASEHVALPPPEPPPAPSASASASAEAPAPPAVRTATPAWKKPRSASPPDGVKAVNPYR